MCLITDQKQLIAEEDITVYKSLTSKLCSMYYDSHFKYELGKLYETNIEESDEWRAFDSEDIQTIEKVSDSIGLFQNLNIDKRKSILSPKGFKCFGQGFHSVLSRERLPISSFARTIVECTIPKGAIYYINQSNLAISNNLIINKICA